MKSVRPSLAAFVDWFRRSAPYIHAHRGRTFVVAFGGEIVAEEAFAHLAHDVALLHSLGVRLVLVHGAAPQIEEQLRQRGLDAQEVQGVPVLDAEALIAVKEAVGTLRVDLEGVLSMGAPNSPMEGARLRVASGNFVLAKPVGVRNGTDFGHSGEVRKVDGDGIRARLDQGAVVLLSPLGYSMTGEVFRLSHVDVARATALAIGAEKLVFLVEGPGVADKRGRVTHQLTPSEADRLVARGRLGRALAEPLRASAVACLGGVRRAHLLSRQVDGALLLELFTRDGIGTMVTAERYEEMRGATLADVVGLLALIQPLEEEGILVRRPRDRLEMEIDRFTVVERDGMVIGCAALYPSPGERIAELACVAIHADYRGTGRGEALLDYMEARARREGCSRVFVLTTHAEHWFIERGFRRALVDDLPVPRRELYNRQRNSKVLVKRLP